MAEAQRLFSKADVRALRPSTSIADSGVVALQDELDRVGQQILLHAMRSRTQRLKEKPPQDKPLPSRQPWNQVKDWKISSKCPRRNNKMHRARSHRRAR